MTTLRSLRKLHQRIAPIIFLPLLLTVVTGVIFDIAEVWFNAPDSLKESIISIHKGAFLGEKLSIFYVILNGLGVVLMLITGISMLKNFKRPKNTSE